VGLSEGRSHCVKLFCINVQDVFIMDTQKGCYVWIGRRASAEEKKNGFVYAHVSRFFIVITVLYLLKSASTLYLKSRDHRYVINYDIHQFITFINLPQTKEEFARVRLFVCLSVSKITQKRMHSFR